ncbi:MAG: NAD(P)-dependent oxidoreductase, partial [Pseudomonadota bacterium]
MTKVLVIGVGGQVSTELVRLKPGWCALETAGQDQLELTDTQVIADYVAARNPDIVINAAAYTAVDLAEKEPEIASLINAVAPGQIAAGAARADAAIIHLSTDYVFDGKAPLLYKEDDPTAPLGVYGQTKLAGERAVMAANDRHIIARTAWVYSAHGKNFVKSMLQLGAAN